jgi:SAM-dependent methyltransferase
MLPLADRSFNKAWSLDVFEHLSPQAFRDVLAEAHRVLEPGGHLFIYTHVRKNGWPAAGVRAVNRLARFAERLGLLDLRQERLRKSDHLNPIADHDELDAVARSAGFEVERKTYYSPVIGAFVENILARMAERALARGAGRRAGGRTAATPDEERGRGAPRRVGPGCVGEPDNLPRSWPSRRSKLDLLLFGRDVRVVFARLRRPAFASPGDNRGGGRRSR